MGEPEVMTREQLDREISKLEAFCEASQEYVRERLEAIKPAVKELRRRERQAKKARTKKPEKRRAA